MVPCPSPTWNGFRPSVRQRRVACEFQIRRRQAGMRVDEVAEFLNWPADMYRAMEEGRTAASPIIVRTVLADFYESDDAEYVSYFCDLAAEGERRNWTQVFVDPTPVWRRMYIGLNECAAHKWMYHPCVIPGIFQTREYAEALVGSVLRAGKPDLAEGIELRLKRQERLHEANPLHVSAVIGEAALTCMVGDSDVTAGQCDRLLMLMDLFNVDMRLLPLSSPLHSAFAQPFIMLDYAKPEGDRGIAYLEHLTRTQFLDEDHEISQYRTAFDRLQAAAYNDFVTRQHISAFREMAKL